MPDIKYAQTEAVDKGSLKVEVLTNRTRRPIEGARITISYSGDPDSTVEEVSADDSGMSEKLTLDAPPLEYSMEPSENQPFAQYTVKVTAPGYRPVSISGVQVFSLYRKFLKSSEIVYNRLEIKNDIAKERRGLRHDVVYEVFCFGLG